VSSESNLGINVCVENTVWLYHERRSHTLDAGLENLRTGITLAPLRMCNYCAYSLSTVGNSAVFNCSQAVISWCMYIVFIN
jgi:hypothetical protein